MLQSQKLPTVDDPRWEINGTISKIHIYPVKSCGAVSPSSGQVKIQKYGLEFNGVMKDRQFLIVDEHNKLSSIIIAVNQAIEFITELNLISNERSAELYAINTSRMQVDFQIAWAHNENTFLHIYLFQVLL